MVPHTLTLHTLTQHNTHTPPLPCPHYTTHTLHTAHTHCRILHSRFLGGTTPQLHIRLHTANNHLHLSLSLSSICQAHLSHHTHSLLHQSSPSLSSISLSLSPLTQLSLYLHLYLSPARHFISISWLLCIVSTYRWDIYYFKAKLPASRHPPLRGILLAGWSFAFGDCYFPTIGLVNWGVIDWGGVNWQGLHRSGNQPAQITGTEAEPQQIVAQRLLSCLQYPVP